MKDNLGHHNRNERRIPIKSSTHFFRIHDPVLRKYTPAPISRDIRFLRRGARAGDLTHLNVWWCREGAKKSMANWPTLEQRSSISQQAWHRFSKQSEQWTPCFSMPQRKALHLQHQVGVAKVLVLKLCLLKTASNGFLHITKTKLEMRLMNIKWLDTHNPIHRQTLPKFSSIITKHSPIYMMSTILMFALFARMCNSFQNDQSSSISETVPHP